MSHHVRCLALWVCLVVPALSAAAPESFRGKARAMDGDSLRVGRQEVRLWGIDAPEFDQSCEREGRPWDCGRAAHAALASRVDGRVVVCEPRDRDAFGRVVSVCRIPGRRSVNEWMVAQGWAVDYRRYSGGAYAAAEREARKAKRGVWSGRFERPDRYRHRQRRRRTHRAERSTSST